MLKNYLYLFIFQKFNKCNMMTWFGLLIIVFIGFFRLKSSEQYQRERLGLRILGPGKFLLVEYLLLWLKVIQAVVYGYLALQWPLFDCLVILIIYCNGQMSSRNSLHNLERLQNIRLCGTTPPIVLVGLDLLHLIQSRQLMIFCPGEINSSWLELRLADTNWYQFWFVIPFS